MLYGASLLDSYLVFNDLSYLEYSKHTSMEIDISVGYIVEISCVNCK